MAKELKQRKKKFMWDIWEAGKDKYTKEMLRAFFEHFSTHNEPVKSNTKMLWEKQKDKNLGIWNISMRLAQWKSRSEKLGWNKKVTQNNKKLPNYYNSKFMAGLNNIDQQEYKKHLESLGFVWNYSPSAGTHILTPDKKRIWL